MLKREMSPTLVFPDVSLIGESGETSSTKRKLGLKGWEDKARRSRRKGILGLSRKGNHGGLGGTENGPR